MKHLLAILVLTLSFTFVDGQTAGKTKNISKPNNDGFFLKIESINLNNQLIGISSRTSNTLRYADLMSPRVFSAVLATLIDSIDNKESKVFAQNNLVKLKTYYGSIIGFGDGLDNLIIMKKMNGSLTVPFTVSTYNGKKTVILSGIFSKSQYNTARLDQSQINSNVIKSVSLPSLMNLKSITEIPELSQVCIAVGFGVKDFAEDISANFGTIIMITPIGVVKSYLRAEVTDNDVVSKSDFYGVSKYSNMTLKKLDIKL